MSSLVSISRGQDDSSESDREFEEELYLELIELKESSQNGLREVKLDIGLSNHYDKDFLK